MRAPDRWWDRWLDVIDPDQPDEQVTQETRIMRWLMRGEAFTGKELGERLGGSGTSLPRVGRFLEAIGFHVERAREAAPDNPQARSVRYRITNPKHEPNERAVDAAQQAALRQSMAVAVAEPEPKPELIPRSNGAHREVELMPALDEPLVVYALARNDDGTVTVGLRNGDRRFLTTLTGALE